MGLTAVIFAPRLIVRVIQPIAAPPPRLCRASAAPDGSRCLWPTVGLFLLSSLLCPPLSLFVVAARSVSFALPLFVF